MEPTCAALGAIGSLAVVDLAGLQVGPGDVVTAGANAPFVKVTGDEAQRIADLFRRLPPGTPARCHSPRLAVRFNANGKVICQASICWLCNNVCGVMEDRDLFTAFDATDPIAQDLLALLERAIGHPVAEEM